MTTKSEKFMSKLRGVCWHNQREQWFARIYTDGKALFLGLFDTEDDAHAAYCEAKRNIAKDRARSLIQQSLPEHQSLQYQNLRESKKLDARLPNFFSNNSAQDRLTFENVVVGIFGWRSVEDGDMDYSGKDLNINIIFK